MQTAKNISDFVPVVEQLQYLSDQLIELIDNQADAVVASDQEQIEQNAERYTDLMGAFKQQEKDFIKNLRALAGSAQENEANPKLEDLKKLYPESSETITGWKKSLGSKTRKLRHKHQKLNTLLEFALERNAEFMRSIYRLHQKNTHYSAGGNKEEFSSGIAINKEA